MYILGLSFDYHDAAAALIHDGKVLAAAEEERFSRKKHDASLPKLAAQFCLDEAGITSSELDRVVFYENPFLKLDRILHASLSGYPKSLSYFNTTIRSWIRKSKIDVRTRIAEELGVPRSHVTSLTHHDTHAAAAFFCSPFDEATIVTLDGVGEYDCTTISHGQGNGFRRLQSVAFPHSIGLFYSALTAFLGFEVNEGEYKVMGMGGFGKPAMLDEFLNLFELHENGTYAIRQDCFNFLCPETVPYTPELVRWLGPPRKPETRLCLDGAHTGDDEVLDAKQSQHYTDIAASVQKCTEEVILHVVSKAVAQTGISNVCLAGGVALNSLANGRIKRELGCRLYVHPAAGDSGGAIGAALLSYYKMHPQAERKPLKTVYLGRAHDEAEILKAFQESYTRRYRKFADEDELVRVTAKHIADGAVVGWHQGRFEWGPRALGCRSILANPMRPDMKAIVNEKIKFREPFRPFAPAVLEERAHEFFEIGEIDSQFDPEYFMISVCDVCEDKKHLVPATTHVDGTARVQMVSAQSNPLYYKLIAAFGELTGVPVILNTSFNLRGEPIVNSPLDAIRTFEWSDMDYLIVGGYIVEKELGS